MSFPLNPSNGQTTTVNHITYVYNSSLGVWNKQGSVAMPNPVASVNGKTGAISITFDDIASSGGTFGGECFFSSHVNVNAGLKSNSLGIGTDAPGTAGQLLATNSITAYYSDERLKKDFRRIEKALDKIDQLTGYLYTQNELAEQFGYCNYEQQVGLKAGDVLKVQPEVVKLAPFDTAADGTSKTGENYLTVQYEKLIPLLVEGIKELRQEIKTIKGE